MNQGTISHIDFRKIKNIIYSYLLFCDTHNYKISEFSGKQFLGKNKFKNNVWKSSTQKNYAKILNKYLLSHHSNKILIRISDNPTTQSNLAKRASRYIPKLEREKFLKVFKEECFGLYRVLLLFFETGCRISEAIMLKRKHIIKANHKYWIILPHIKTKERPVEITSNLYYTLLEKEYSKGLKFCFPYRNKNSLRNLLKKAYNKFGLKWFCPHSWRHTKATIIAEKHGIQKACKYFQWSSLDMANRYNRNLTPFEKAIAHDIKNNKNLSLIDEDSDEKNHMYSKEKKEEKSSILLIYKVLNEIF